MIQHSTRCYTAIKVPPLALYVNPSSTSDIFFAVHADFLQCYPIPFALIKVPAIHIIFSYTFSKERFALSFIVHSLYSISFDSNRAFINWHPFGAK